MQSLLLGGILVVFFPDGIFKRIRAQQQAAAPLTAMLLSSFFLTAVGIRVIAVVLMPGVRISLPQALLACCLVYLASILLNAVVSWLLNAVYTRLVTVRGKRLNSDFLSNFLCRAYVIPWWLFMILLYTTSCARPDDMLLRVLTGACIVRMLDLEARLLKVSYRVRLAHAYGIVAATVALLGLGMYAGAMLR